MGLIENISGWFRSRIVGWLESGGSPKVYERSESMAARRDYRLGAQKRFLRKSREGFDDNVIGNMLGLAVDRSVSLLFGKPPEFEWEEGTPEELTEFIEQVWEDNNKPILLHKLAMYGAEDGTVFAKLVPDESKPSGWRIVAQDPIFKDIICDPDDDEKVIAYVTQYKTHDLNGMEIARRETIAGGNYGYEVRTDASGSSQTVIVDNPAEFTTNWIITNEVSSRATGGKWQVVSEEVWQYALPPIVHWQNLPMIGSTWGMPDIGDDTIEMQDKSNFAISNINRILRLFAHPFRWSRGFGGKRVAQGNEAELDVGPDKMPNTESATAEIFQLAAVGDVPGAVSHAQNLRQMIFDVTRNTDITSMKDKVGALTNFGLRILFFDALNKLDTKRALYGWGLREINRRLQMFSNVEPVDCDIVWSDPLPVDETALRQNLQADLNMGVVSKATVAAKLGYDYDDEKERMEEEQANSDNVGAMILRAFDRTGGGGFNTNAAAERQAVQAQPR